MFNSLNSKSQSPSADQPPGKPPPWIFDTGASFHMTGSRDLLRDLTSIAPISIKLPDDRLAVASHRGSVVLPNGAIIPRVSYVPNLDCNLLSSAQLTAESDCVVTLTSKFFVIQDLATRTVIGLGEVRDGVYWLRYLSSKAVGSARSSMAATRSFTKPKFGRSHGSTSRKCKSSSSWLMKPLLPRFYSFCCLLQSLAHASPCPVIKSGNTNPICLPLELFFSFSSIQIFSVIHVCNT
ncbi:hypothetical protein [Psychrobacter sp. TB2]|uniref:hypothetical protein n=1 Tax=Psychrobacter sp. TB2 TaxID=1055808 RepID=UPI000402244D